MDAHSHDDHQELGEPEVQEDAIAHDDGAEVDDHEEVTEELPEEQ